MNSMRIIVLSTVTLLLFVAAITVTAEPGPWAAPISDHFSYQGRLTDENGLPVPAGTYEITFTTYHFPPGYIPKGSQNGPTDPIGTETHMVEVGDDGVFYTDSVGLGGLNRVGPIPLPFRIDREWYPARYLQLEVEGEVIEPITKMLTVPSSWSSSSVSGHFFSIPGGAIFGDHEYEYPSFVRVLGEEHISSMGFYNSGDTTPGVEILHGDTGQPSIHLTNLNFNPPVIYEDAIVEATNMKLRQRADDGEHEVDLNTLGLTMKTDNDTAIHISRLGNSYFSGNVGVGVKNPTEPLEVDGTVYSTSGGFKFPDGTTQATAVTNVGGADALRTSSIGLSIFGTTNVLFETILAPTAGYVLAIATCEIEITHINSGGSWVDLGISDVSATMHQAKSWFIPSAAPSGTYRNICTAQRIIQVGQGLTNIFLVANRQTLFGGSSSVNEANLSLIFFPEWYEWEPGVSPLGVLGQDEDRSIKNQEDSYHGTPRTPDSYSDVTIHGNDAVDLAYLSKKVRKLDKANSLLSEELAELRSAVDLILSKKR